MTERDSERVGDSPERGRGDARDALTTTPSLATDPAEERATSAHKQLESSDDSRKETKYCKQVL